MKTEWWLDWSALPDLLWARLQVHQNGAAEVFDLDGKVHHFSSEQEARNWLFEDEYSRLEQLIQSEEVPADTISPSAASDEELLPKMLVRTRI
jgi:hypothetical protein